LRPRRGEKELYNGRSEGYYFAEGVGNPSEIMLADSTEKRGGSRGGKKQILAHIGKKRGLQAPFG